MAKNFRELRKKMSLEAQEKSLALAQKYSEEMPLDGEPDIIPIRIREHPPNPR